MENGSTVNIINQKLQKLYGVKPSDDFVIQSNNRHGKVLLTNGWYISLEHLKAKIMFNLEEAVDEVLADFMDEDKSFTSFDVDAEVRKRNEHHSIAYSDVKDIVHQTMNDEDSEYIHEMLDMGQPMLQALYHPEGYDPSTYVVGKGAQVIELFKVPEVSYGLALDDEDKKWTFYTEKSEGVDVGVYEDSSYTVEKKGFFRRLLAKIGVS